MRSGVEAICDSDYSHCCYDDVCPRIMADDQRPSHPDNRETIKRENTSLRNCSLSKRERHYPSSRFTSADSGACEHRTLQLLSSKSFSATSPVWRNRLIQPDIRKGFVHVHNDDSSGKRDFPRTVQSDDLSLRRRA